MGPQKLLNMFQPKLTLCDLAKPALLLIFLYISSLETFELALAKKFLSNFLNDNSKFIFSPDAHRMGQNLTQMAKVSEALRPYRSNTIYFEYGKHCEFFVHEDELWMEMKGVRFINWGKSFLISFYNKMDKETYELDGFGFCDVGEAAMGIVCTEPFITCNFGKLEMKNGKRTSKLHSATTTHRLKCGKYRHSFQEIESGMGQVIDEFSKNKIHLQILDVQTFRQKMKNNVKK